MIMREEILKKTVLRGILLLLGALFLWAALKYALPVLFPFALAYIIARFISPAAKKLCRKTKIPEKIWASLIIVTLSALLSFALWKAGSLIVREAGEILDSLAEMLTDDKSPLSELISKGSDFLEKFTVSGEELSGTLTGMLSESLSRLSMGVASLAGSFIVAAPSVLFTVAVTFIALFYFALDMDGIRREFKKFLPQSVINTAGTYLDKLMRAAGKFLKAYMTIMLITFGELLVGFLIIGVDYAFLAALLTSVVDLLPVLGTGTVLIPWAIFLFLGGEGGKAVAMTALLAVMYIVRQFIEPKIVGECAGVHPLLALVSVFAGFCLAGVGGMILGPVILNGISVFWEEKS